MPLEKYKRGHTYWVKGRCDGIDGYVRTSLATTNEAVADAKLRQIERQALKRAILGDDAPKPEDELTFAQAVLLYDAKPKEAQYLIPIIPILGDDPVKKIPGKRVRDLARELYPDLAADTWKRYVLTPVRAVINNAAELEMCAHIRIKGYTRNEVMAQDRMRGKVSRQRKTPGSWEFVNAFRAQAYKDKLPYMAALCLFMFTRGVRISQAIAITSKDLNLQNAKVFIPAAKGHPAQWIWIDQQTIVDLANLKPRKGRVFGYLGRDSVNRTWKRICTRAGIENLSPHAAGRHGYGTEMIVRQKVDPVTTAKDGRWSSPSIPLEVYSHSEDSDATTQAAMNQGRFRTNPVQQKKKGIAK